MSLTRVIVLAFSHLAWLSPAFSQTPEPMSEEARQQEIEALEQDMADARRRLDELSKQSNSTPDGVNTGESETTPPPPAATSPAPEPAPSQSPPPSAAPTVSPEPPRAQTPDGCPDHRCISEERESEKRHYALQEGDAILYLRLVDVGGLGAEYMVSDRFSIFLDVGRLSDRDDDDDDGTPQERLLPAAAVDRDENFFVDGGFRFHVYKGRVFNADLSLGLANAGYEVAGGVDGYSLFGRIGSGLRWQLSSFHLGLDFAWYPVEFRRWVVLDDEAFVVSLDDDERWEDRFLGSAVVGFRF